jgi:hypothetical protein
METDQLTLINRHVCRVWGVFRQIDLVRQFPDKILGKINSVGTCCVVFREHAARGLEC